MAFSLLVVGGDSSSLEQNCLSSIEIAKGLSAFKPFSWMKKRRRGPSIFRDRSGVILIAGGCAEPKDHLSSCEILRATQNCEDEIIDFNEPGFSCAAYCTLDSSAHIIAGGYDGWESLNSMRLLSIEGEYRYNYLKPLPTRLKNATAVPLDNQNLLLIGGWDESRTLRTIFRYTLEIEECFQEALLPCPVEGHSATKIGDHVFIIGGFDGISVVSQIVCYNVVEKTCEILRTKLRIARENHGASIIEGDRFVIVVGGWDGNQALDECEVFEVTKERPYLIPCETRMKLVEPRNKPAVISIEI